MECESIANSKKRRMDEEDSNNSDVITLNVGGERFQTRRSTLAKCPDTMLGAMFSGKMKTVCESDGSYFFDRDPKGFRYILEYYRSEIFPSSYSMKFDCELDREMWKSNLEFFGILEKENAPKQSDISKEIDAEREKTSKLLMGGFLASWYYKKAKAENMKRFVMLFPRGIKFDAETMTIPDYYMRTDEKGQKSEERLAIEFYSFLDTSGDYFTSYVKENYGLEASYTRTKKTSVVIIRAHWPVNPNTDRYDSMNPSNFITKPMPCMVVKLTVPA